MQDNADIILPRSLAAWSTPAFNATLKAEVEAVNGDLLPLQQGLSQTSYAITSDFSVIIISVLEKPDTLSVKVGISYRGIIPGCSCADDPTPIDEVMEYCEVRLDIDRKTAQTVVNLLP